MSITCKTCNKDVVIKWKKNPSKWCSIKCKNNDIDIKAKISKGLRVRYQDPINRKFLRDIGRKGGFGKTGYTDIGIYYQSSFEEKCFMYLDYCNIKYHSHKNIPNSTKISDIYLIDKDIWIELDGIDREKRQKWLGNDYQYWLDKLNLYKNQNLHYYVIKTFDEFIEIIIDKGV